MPSTHRGTLQERVVSLPVHFEPNTRIVLTADTRGALCLEPVGFQGDSVNEPIHFQGTTCPSQATFLINVDGFLRSTLLNYIAA